MEVGELKACARDFIFAGFEMLRGQEALPRPRVRYLEMGRHYSGLDLMNLPQFTTLAERIATDSRISRIHRQTPRQPSDFFRPYLETLFERVLNDTVDGEIDEAIFSKWFSRFKSELLSPTATFVHIWALEGLEMDVLEVRIDDDTVIHRFALHELDTLLEMNVGVQGWTWDKQLSWDGACGLIVTHKVSKVDRPSLRGSPGYPIEKLLRTLEAMHLHKEGNVSAPKWVHFHQADLPLTRPLIIEREHARGWPGPPYHLVESDVGSIRQLSEDINWISKDAPQDDSTGRKLRLALSFFESSYTMKRGIESLVDLCIALEALFLKDKAELSYRLAHRVAAFLSTDDKGSRELFKRVRALYELRSAYVHGAPLPAKEERKLLAKIGDGGSGTLDTWNMPILAIRDCVRRSLKLMIRMKRKQAFNLSQSFYEKIDQFVFDKKAQRQFQEEVGLVVR